MKNEPRELLNKMFSAAVAAAQPSRCIAPFLPPPPKGRTIVIGAGKASASMASALEKIWPGELTGMVVTRYGYAVQCDRIEIVEAAHPVPDINGLRGTQTVLDLVSGLNEDDLVICLMSGGASSLLSLPLDPLTLEEKKNINRALLNSGAAISEINCVRRHLSAVKGGRLAAACHPAQLLTLLISDVPGDSPVDIGSGPTVADPSTCADALNIVRRYAIEMPLAAMQILESGAGESIKPGNPSLASSDYQIIAAPQIALEAAAEVAKAAGIPCYILSDRIEGEARDVGKVMAGIALQVARHNQPFKTPCILLSGGETTVSVKGDGRGGRNVEFLLSLAIALEGEDGVHAIACDTDGVDGRDEIAGAIISPNTLDRAWASGMNPQASLDNNDGHTFFRGLGDSVICGPTLTNVNDFRAVLVLPISADHQQEN
ncbi:Putative hydroxypyruvate reductase [Paraburkholderia kirstenboschensis]|uniref:glycerate kinase type-2 family protein n=1 Tax=Paraburkholderia kirstenboschensis TaxID=1245436 RepID=UPI000AE0F842|nr:glycerate kinase [Paraburkholderia kirstenboschensis]CAD6561480.1 Putative hydroxypyruvate reductase [Paraburkholderia kirstenboschensis]